ncbi:uncharacterized protein [Cicer arietinum]|uniref:Zinc finger protein 10-like n=1 Tax=Cicer arietinum TaxID=3827 RepID=A0A1S2Z5W8_CICAR|nr:zinc finger protein 10-like [Cicer arietinum]
MEQDQCWIQTKRKHSSMSSNLVSSLANNLSSSTSCYGDSWEEQAFAEDSACIWPPRSYSCSFCRREFRSAQALGGHMNVHRKDRARLKQPSSDPQNDHQILYHHHHHHHHQDLESHHHHHNLQKPLYQSSNNSLANYNNSLFPSPSVCGLVYKTNPNCDPNFVASTSSLSLSKPNEETLIPFYDSPFPHHNIVSHLNSSKSWLNLHGDDRFCSSNFQHEVDHNIDKKVSKGMDSRFRAKGSENNDESDVSMSLSLVLCRTHQPFQFESTKEEDLNCKKRKIDASSNLLLSKSSSFDKQHMQAKMFDFSPSSIDELDLELRLGTKSKV